MASAPARSHGTGPLNPFESTFALFRAVRDEIQELKAEVNELRVSRDTRLDKVELDLEGLRSSLGKRIEQLESNHQDEKVSRNMNFDRMGAFIEELRRDRTVRLDQLDAQVKAEMNLRFEQNQALDQKIRTEVSQLRAFVEKTSIEFIDHKQKAEIDKVADRQRHDELRQDVEKLAMLLSDSSLTRDPFNQLGYRPFTPAAAATPLGTTAHGSHLPPLLGSSRGLREMSGSLLSSHMSQLDGSKRCSGP